jgi:hypothetical protein
MAEEKVEGREAGWQQLFPWTHLFRGFQIALGLDKLFLAALGILFMTAGWVFLATLFGLGWNMPRWEEEYKNRKDGFAEYKRALNRYNLMHETAGVGPYSDRFVVGDFADNADEFDKLNDLYGKAGGSTNFNEVEFLKLVDKDPTLHDKRRQFEFVGQHKPGGFLAQWPFFVDRGPNPYLLVTGRAHAWEKGGFGEWLITKQVPVLIEPLIQMFSPIAYMFDPRAFAWDRFYFFLVVVWTLGVWSLFGGAITRIAAVQIARGEKIGMFEALAFTRKRLLSYLTAPLFPLLLIFLLLVFMFIFAWFFAIPILGDIFVAGLFWPFMILFGLGIAIALIGLIGWPLMAATVSAEGTDAWEAFSRSYSYVFQRPWQYLWYGLVMIAYGAVVVFFIGFMGSFVIYLSKWGVAKPTGIDYVGRNPSFLFIYSPTSFGWRNLLLQDATTVDGQPVVGAGGEIIQDNFTAYKSQLMWWNYLGAALVTIWVCVLFLLVLGFGYSFFWSTMTISYMLLRKSVDTAEMEEVYLEEEDQEGYSGPLAPAPAAKPGTQMVEAPTLKTPQATTPTAPVSTPAAMSAAPAPAAEKTATVEKTTIEPTPPASTTATESKKDGAGGDSSPAP